MSPIVMVLAAALTFGLCYLFDKGYTKLFRSKQQHKTGLQVRVSRRYASFGLILVVLGLSAIFSGLSSGRVLLIGGILVLLMGFCLIAHYMSFSIFYDADSFILTTRKNSRTYRFQDISHQKLYQIQGGSIVVELHMCDGSAVSIHTAMDGAYAFLDHAFYEWCRQKELSVGACSFHDPGNHLWFPGEEDV